MWEYWRTGTVLPQFCVCEGIFHDHGVPLNIQLERVCSWSSSFFIKTAVVKHWHLLKLFPFHFSPWVLSLWHEWDVALHRSPCRVPGNAEVLIQEHRGCRLPSLTPGYICHLFWQASEDTKDWNCETPVVLFSFGFWEDLQTPFWVSVLWNSAEDSCKKHLGMMSSVHRVSAQAFNLWGSVRAVVLLLINTCRFRSQLGAASPAGKLTFLAEVDMESQCVWRAEFLRTHRSDPAASCHQAGLRHAVQCRDGWSTQRWDWPGVGAPGLKPLRHLFCMSTSFGRGLFWWTTTSADILCLISAGSNFQQWAFTLLYQIKEGQRFLPMKMIICCNQIISQPSFWHEKQPQILQSCEVTKNFLPLLDHVGASLLNSLQLC